MMASPDDSDDISYDFSEIPDVAWVQILSYLSLGDRYRVSLTCRTLYEHFSHPSLWASVDMILLGDLNKYEYENYSGVVLPQKYVHMIEKFGKYFQDLNLLYNGYLTILPAHCSKVLSALAETCRLENLTLQVGGMITKDDFLLRKARESDMRAFCDIVSKAFRLKSFNLKTWPMYPGMTTANILVDLKCNPKIVDLEELKLYWQGASSGTWATQNAVLPTSEETCDLVTRFTYLRVLCLRSPMMSDELITELFSPNRVPLERLGILVCYSKHGPTGRGNLPQISCESWQALVTKSPELAVDITVVNRVPYVELASLLLPEVPVTSINFMRYSRCSQDDIYSVVDKYSKSLKRYVNYSDSSPMDHALTTLVSKCENLIYLIHYGAIHYDTVLTLASAKGRSWYRFEINGENIATNPVNPTSNDDLVIVQGEGGEYYINRHNFSEHDDSVKQGCLMTLSRTVGQMLQQRWAPVGKHEIIELLEREHLAQCKVVSKKVMEANRPHE